MNRLVDTHCHIHAALAGRDDNTARKWHEAGETDPDELVKSAAAAGVNRLLCVGTDLADSRDAVEFAENRENCWASIGVHPHEAKDFLAGHSDLSVFEELVKKPKVVAIGEVGLDYYYEHSPRQAQLKLFEMFLQLAADTNLPVIFHVREAFDDLWPVLDNFQGIKGVLHSFTADEKNLEQGLGRGLFIGLNGIMTFTRDQSQLKMAKAVPLDRLVLETDSPYLAPKPYRGKVCKPAYIKEIAEFLADIRSEDFVEFAEATTKNAAGLFGL